MKIKNNALVIDILLNFMKKNLFMLILLLSVLILSGFAEVFPVKYMQKIVDMLMAGSEFKSILILIVTWYSFRIIMSISGFVAGWISGVLGSKLGKVFRELLFARIKNSEFINLSEASSSETVTRTLEDVHDLGNLIVKPITMVGRNLFIFVWSFIFLFQIDRVLLMSSLPLGILMLAVGKWVSKLSYGVWKIQKMYQTKIVSCLMESVSACREIILFSLWNRQENQFDEYNKGVSDAQSSTAILTSGLSNFLDALWPIATVLCFILGGYRVLNGDLSTGGLIAFMWYVQWIIHPISQISNYYAEVQKSIVAVERIQEMFEWFPSPLSTEYVKSVESSIKLENVSFGYNEQNTILKNVNFSISKGEVVALVGETGCGKSTLLKIILGLLKPKTGKIVVDGVVSDSKELCGSPSVSAVFHDSYLFNLSIKDNILIGINEEIEEKEELIEKVIEESQINQFTDVLAEGKNTIVGEQASRLSSGQRQRVALARALARKPNFLILDEATSTVDTAIEEQIYKAIFSKSEFGCIITSHRLASIIGADKIFMMKDGEIIATGTHQELVNSCDEYLRLYNAQILEEDN